MDDAKARLYEIGDSMWGDPEPAPAEDARLQVLDTAQAIQQWEERADTIYVPSPVPSFNDRCGGGFPVGAITTVLAYTGCYKSEFARHAIRHAALNGCGALHVDVELGISTIVERHLSQISGVPHSRVRQRRFRQGGDNQAIAAAAAQVASESWKVLCPGGLLPFETLGTAIQRALPEDKPTLVVLDSAQRLAVGSKKKENRNQVEEFFRWCEGFAHSNPVALLIISEQNRPSGEKGKKHPTTVSGWLTSGAESRAVEFTTSVMVGLAPVRPDSELEDTSEPDDDGETRIDMYLPKNRYGPDAIKLPEELVVRRPCWRMDVEQKSVGNQKLKILHAMVPGEDYSINQIQKLSRVGKRFVHPCLVELQGMGKVAEVGRKWRICNVQ